MSAEAFRKLPGTRLRASSLFPQSDDSAAAPDVANHSFFGATGGGPIMYTVTRAFSGVGTNALNRAIAVSKALSGTGTAGVNRQIALTNKAFSGTGTAALTKGSVVTQIMAFAGTGTAALSRSIGKGLSYAATGVNTLSRQIRLSRAMTGTGTATVSDALTSGKATTFSGTGTAGFSKETTLAGPAKTIRRIVAGIMGVLTRWIAPPS